MPTAARRPLTARPRAAHWCRRRRGVLIGRLSTICGRACDEGGARGRPREALPPTVDGGGGSQRRWCASPRAAAGSGWGERVVWPRQGRQSLAVPTEGDRASACSASSHVAATPVARSACRYGRNKGRYTGNAYPSPLPRSVPRASPRVARLPPGGAPSPSPPSLTISSPFFLPTRPVPFIA